MHTSLEYFDITCTQTQKKSINLYCFTVLFVRKKTNSELSEAKNELDTGVIYFFLGIYTCCCPESVGRYSFVVSESYESLITSGNSGTARSVHFRYQNRSYEGLALYIYILHLSLMCIQSKKVA